MTSKPLLIDWYCCQGGAARGYADAGFEVVGVDIKSQPHYPFQMIVADVLNIPDGLLAAADAHHASPPCQGLTEMNNDKSRHLNLIPATRAKLQRLGKPYVIENVRAAKAHLQNPISLFGTMFGNSCTDSQGRTFVLSRERCFEANWPLGAPVNPGAQGRPIANVIGGHFRVRSGDFRTGKGTGRTVDLPGENRRALAAELMGMEWATMEGMSEAVPPSYTREIGRQLMLHMDERRAAA